MADLGGRIETSGLMLRSLLLLNRCEQYDIRVWERFEAMGAPPEAFIREGLSIWKKLGISERGIDIMSKAASSGWVDRELDMCEKLGVSVITCRDAAFPPSLMQMSDTPLVLYAKGRIPPPAAKSIAVVGTRRCSPYASKIAREIGRRAAGIGWNVVSGGAKGIDGFAHLGCLEGGGFTAAILGTGVDMVYPSEHRELFERILEKGALYSEYALGARGESWRFPRRNRIISGLASKIVVAEAPHKSGAMITARFAAEGGREVWAVPGRIDDGACAGSNRLIFDGAFPLVDFDVFFGTPEQGRTKELFGGDELTSARRAAAPKMSADEKKILSLLALGGDITIDNLAGEAKMSAAEVFKIISVMSLRGLVLSSGPGRYRPAG
ncbi:MAG: DNA-processing protein DprA [Synergistaceae bacterium]|nr:DNA-processing protein DprA [Synergistaceae bacterium]